MEISDADLVAADGPGSKFVRLAKRFGMQLLKVAQSGATNAPVLGSRILQAAEAALKEHRTLGGREILRMVFRHYKPHDTTVEYYRLIDV